jgi:hypothetical protein
VRPHLDLLLSALYDRLLHPDHRADLRKSGLTDETIAAQKIRTIPPHMIDPLLGFETPKVVSAYLIPFPDPRGGWMDHVRMKIFPTLTTREGAIKYLQPKRSGVRIYFPLATLDAVLHSSAPLYVCEGEKKALAVAQLGCPVIGICGVEGWHLAGSRALHPDLDDVGLEGRLVDLLPDGDWKTNPDVNRAVMRLAEAFERRRATARLVVLPEPV